MEFFDVVRDRYSCRQFDSSKPVEDEKLEKILEAGIVAPTAKNAQPVKIWVLKSEEARAKIRSVMPFKWADTPVVLVVGGTKEGAFVRPSDNRNFGDVDASIIATHLMLAVENVGLGSTWVGFFDVPKTKELFPEMKDYDLVAIFPIGYPASDAQPSERHTLRKAKAEMVKYL